MTMRNEDFDKDNDDDSGYEDDNNDYDVEVTDSGEEDDDTANPHVQGRPAGRRVQGGHVAGWEDGGVGENWITAWLLLLVKTKNCFCLRQMK